MKSLVLSNQYLISLPEVSAIWWDRETKKIEITSHNRKKVFFKKSCESPKFVMYTDGEFYSPFFNEGLGKTDLMYWSNDKRKIYSLEKMCEGKEKIHIPTHEISTAPIINQTNEVTDSLLKLLEKRGSELLNRKIGDLTYDLVGKGCKQVLAFKTSTRYIRSLEDEGFVGLVAYTYIGIVGA